MPFFPVIFEFAVPTIVIVDSVASKTRFRDRVLVPSLNKATRIYLQIDRLPAYVLGVDLGELPFIHASRYAQQKGFAFVRNEPISSASAFSHPLGPDLLPSGTCVCDYVICGSYIVS
jgi:hypothetical protein